MKHRILIVDDEPGIRDALRQVLEYEGYELRAAASGGEGLTIYPEFRPHLVVLDVKMAGLDGLDTLTRLREDDPAATVVMISGHGTIQTAVEATQRGAFDFLEKPLDTDRLLLTVRNALAHRQLAGENERLRAQTAPHHALVGDSRALAEVKALISKVGPTAARVLITGENGTGKELVARALHDASPRKAGPFVEVNCAAIPAELIESELFGHMKGSFTGAFADRAGKFEQADGGTLFLDEIGDMSPSAQSKVLRALQEGVVTRIGGARNIEVDVRVVAATNKDLRAEIAGGRFREDLLYRLNVVEIAVPPLRERLEDIPALVRHFTTLLVKGAGVGAKPYEEAAIGRLQRHGWPGNVRELRNVVERALILAPGRTVTAADIERLLPGGAGIGASATHAAPGGGEGMAGGGDTAFLHAPTFEAFKQEAERAYLEAKLREHEWNVSETARALEMPRSNLYKKIEKYGLSRGA
ncbi:MAG TPA: sigma-54 dependent transcriptional regulator [Gemmatimonadales bacterium]|nr:sigma-54 dependent transcriptional regulator [Gemmatimonadales bacterium]